MPITNQDQDGNAFDLPTILAKIKKVQALTSSSNAGEAASAAAQFQRMMFRYNLTLQQVDGWQEQDTSKYVRQDTYIDAGWDTNLNWRRDLMHYVTKFNFCSSVALHASKQVAIIGRAQNIQLCTYLFEYLSTEIVRLADEAYLQTDISGSSLAWRNAFYRGAINEVYKTLQAQRAQDEQQTGGTALARTTDAQLEQAKSVHFKNLRSSGKRTINSAQGLEQGKAAGRNIRISDALTDAAYNPTPKQLT